MRVSMKKRYLTLLVRYLKPLWLQVIALSALLLTSMIMQLLNPQIVGQFIDTATSSGASKSLLMIGCIFLIVVIVDQVSSIAANYLSTKIAWNATNQLRYDLIKHCLALDLSYHKEHSSGEMIERIDGDISQLNNFFSQFAINLFHHTLLLLVVLVLFCITSWLVGIVMIIFVAVALILLSFLRKPAIPAWEKMREASAQLFGDIGELLSSTETISANGATPYSLQRFTHAGRSWSLTALKANIIGLFQSMGSRFFFACGTGLVLGLGTYLWSSQSISMGTVYKLFAYTTLLLYPVLQLQSQMQDLQKAEASLKRVQQLLDTSSVLKNGTITQLPDEPPAISFEQVSFGYHVDEMVLHNVTFQLAPGKVLGLLGRTGSGKTTITRLLFRLYDIQQGQIFLGGIPIQNIQLEHLRHYVGIVTQDVQLFHASVRNNLTFFDPGILDSQILATLEDVGLMPWYSSLSQGLDTVLGGNETGLSAGEAQLLAFARIFLRNPRIVILDEASSRLDPATEHLIERATSKIFTGRTGIIIAHRLASVQKVDDILILENGIVVEVGHRNDLSNDATSRFAALLKKI